MIEILGAALGVFTLIGLPVSLLAWLGIGWESVRRVSE